MKKLKKFLFIAIVLVVVLGIAGIILTAVFLNNIVKSGIETVAPPITKTTVKVESVNISALSGAAGINGFVVGSPEGYVAPSVISLGKAAVQIEPKSVLDEKVIIRSIAINAPEITFEGNPFGKNNLQQIMDNVNAAAGAASEAKKPAEKPASQPAPAKGASKKLQVDHIEITGVKVTARVIGLENVPISVTIPDIKFDNLGSGPEGITAVELTQKILEKVSAESIDAVGARAKEIGIAAANAVIKGAADNANKAAAQGVEKLNKGLNNLLGK